MIFKIGSIITLYFILFTSTINAQKKDKDQVFAKSYEVHKLDTTNFDYKNDPKLQWSLAKHNTDFTYPWREELSPLTLFRALHDDVYLYFRYDVLDLDIYSNDKTGLKKDVIESDRIELFFLSDQKMEPYYCLEIDSNAKVLDYRARYYREYDMEWNWPEEHIEIVPFTKENGYGIQGKISLAYLREIMVLQEDTIHLGLFRAEMVGIKTSEPEFKWISWVSPTTVEPDFHVPSAFGTFLLAD